MARIRLTTHVLPCLMMALLIVVFYVVPQVRSGVKQIDATLESICAEVGASDRESCVLPLVELLNNENESFQRRNRAIWALGQLADARALPALESSLTGEDCPDPCPRDSTLCQREIQKAIRWCRGEAWLVQGFRWLSQGPWKTTDLLH